MDPTAYTIETLLDFPAEEDNKITIVKQPSSSFTPCSNPDEITPEKLEWIDDKDSFPSVDTFVGIRTTPPARIYKHLSPVSVLENTVTIACDNLATSATHSRRTSRGKKRVPAENSKDPDYPNMPTHDIPTEEQDMDSNGLVLKKKRKVTSSTSGRKCQHCEAKGTPQWRAGPMGPKTLCKACGVRYKSGRLMPEYRPANSPTFSSKLHSNSHRKVVEMRKQKLDDVQELTCDVIISMANTLSVALGSALLHLPDVGGICPCPNMPILKQPSSSSTPSSNLEDIIPEFLEEKLEWIDDKESFPSVDTFVGISTIPPTRICKHLSQVSVLENNTVTSASDSLATSVTRSRRTLCGKKRVHDDFYYYFMPTQEQDSDIPTQEQNSHSNDLVQTKKGKVASSTSGRKCQLCEAQETPQWRVGPMGPNSLCNACGVRWYKFGRLLPEVPGE